MPRSNKCKMDGSCHQNARAVDKGQEEERCPTLQEWHGPVGSEFLGEPRSVLVCVAGGLGANKSVRGVVADCCFSHLPADLP